MAAREDAKIFQPCSLPTTQPPQHRQAAAKPSLVGAAHLKALRNSAQTAFRVERKKTRGEGDHTDETSELPAERGKQERLLWVLHEQQGLTHTVYFAKSSSPDAPNQKKKKKKKRPGS